MAGIRSDALLTFKRFPGGIDNRSDEASLPDDRLRAAENVDIDAQGLAMRRPGVTLRDAGAKHSLWSDARYPRMLAIEGSTLIAYDRALTLSTLASGLGRPYLPMAFTVMHDRCYYSNGYDRGELDSDGDRRDWAPEQPGGQPLVAAAAAGGLAAGDYQVAITFVDIDGRESGSTLAALVAVGEGQGIALTAIPQPVAVTTTLRVYVSGANGDILYLARELIAGATTATIGAHTAGRPIETQFLKPLPAGQIVRAWGGRLLSADGAFVRWSPALHYGLHDPVRGWVRFPDDIALMEPAGQAQNAGLYVASGNRTYYMTGPNPAEWQRVIAHAAGAAPGSAQQIDAEKLKLEGVTGLVPVWYTTEGRFVAGLPGGTVVALSADHYTGPVNVDRASLALRQLKGCTHVIAALRGGSQATGLRATDTAVGEVWRGGVRVE